MYPGGAPAGADARSHAAAVGGLCNRGPGQYQFPARRQFRHFSRCTMPRWMVPRRWRRYTPCDLQPRAAGVSPLPTGRARPGPMSLLGRAYINRLSSPTRWLQAVRDILPIPARLRQGFRSIDCSRPTPGAVPVSMAPFRRTGWWRRGFQAGRGAGDQGQRGRCDDQRRDGDGGRRRPAQIPGGQRASCLNSPHGDDSRQLPQRGEREAGGNLVTAMSLAIQ